MSLTDSLRSATYNPEAEKAMAAEREKANKARKEVQTWLDQYSKGYVDNYASKTYWPKWTLTTMDKLIKDTQNGFHPIFKHPSKRTKQNLKSCTKNNYEFTKQILICLSRRIL